MASVCIGDQVRLLHDAPRQNLHRGAEGTVRSMWCSPELVYEVEFGTEGGASSTRILLPPTELEESDGSSLAVPGNDERVDASFFSA